MKKITTLTFALAIFLQTSGQTQQDTIYNYITSTPVVVDGVAAEGCWDNADWYTMDNIWIGGAMAAGDFEGKFKVSWDADYLYLLIEVVDNIISDDHADPLDSWWDDDCVEIFIDEDRSKGWHQNDENAFAYHVSTFYDAIDMGASGGINYKDHIDVVMTDQGDNTYLWELAIKIYADDYDHGSPEASRVALSPEKVMGFSLAYCDNDETTSRENFIGSMTMPAGKENVNYQTADYFGSMKLLDPDYVPVGIESKQSGSWQYYPNPASDILHISGIEDENAQHELTIRSVSGQVLRTEFFENGSYATDISDLKAGIYLVSIKADQTEFSRSLIKL